MELEDLGDAHAKRRIHENGDFWQTPQAVKLAEGVDELLRAADREGWHDDLASLLEGLEHDFFEPLQRGFERCVDTVSVGALEHQVIRSSGWRVRITDDGQILAAEIAREQEPLRRA